MNEFDNKLEILLKSNAAIQINDKAASDDFPKLVPEIKQAFTDAGYVSPENAQRVQEMVNNMAQLANDAMQLPTLLYVKPNAALTKAQNLMTGREWYDRFWKELKAMGWDNEMRDPELVYDASKLAAGLAE